MSPLLSPAQIDFRTLVLYYFMICPHIQAAPLPISLYNQQFDTIQTNAVLSHKARHILCHR